MELKSRGSLTFCRAHMQQGRVRSTAHCPGEPAAVTPQHPRLRWHVPGEDGLDLAQGLMDSEWLCQETKRPWD